MERLLKMKLQQEVIKGPGGNVVSVDTSGKLISTVETEEMDALNATGKRDQKVNNK